VAGSEDSLLVELGSIRDALVSVNMLGGGCAADGAARAVSRLQYAVARPIRIAVMGEENSGKSLLINYLLKHQVLPSGSFAGENTQLLIRHAPEASVHAVSADGARNRLTSKAFGRLVKPDMRGPDPNAGVIYDATRPQRSAAYASLIAAGLSGGRPGTPQAPMKLIEVGLPLSFLRRVEIIEVRSYPAGQASAASKAFGQVDVAIWCTLATQAWKETEVAAWKRIPPGRRKLALMFVTYRDAIRRAADETRITARLRQATTGLFDDVVILSLQNALQSLLAADEDTARALHHKSNVDAAEKAIAGMIEVWQWRRLQKAGRLLGRLAERLGGQDGAAAGGRTTHISQRLGALAADFLNASPSISLTEKAA
jgi:hypothetical protein